MAQKELKSMNLVRYIMIRTDETWELDNPFRYGVWDTADDVRMARASKEDPDRWNVLRIEFPAAGEVSDTYAAIYRNSANTDLEGYRVGD
jgi:hypothetical protein